MIFRFFRCFSKDDVDSAGINFRNALIGFHTESRQHFVHSDADIPGLIARVDASNEHLLLRERAMADAENSTVHDLRQVVTLLTAFSSCYNPTCAILFVRCFGQSLHKVEFPLLQKVHF